MPSVAALLLLSCASPKQAAVAPRPTKESEPSPSEPRGIGGLGPVVTPDGIAWVAYDESVLETWRLRGRPVLVAFVADWAQRSKYDEKAILETDPVRNALTRSWILPMRADDTSMSATIDAKLATLGVTALPTYGIWLPDGTHELLPLPLDPVLLVARLDSAARRFPPERFIAK